MFYKVSDPTSGTPGCVEKASSAEPTKTVAKPEDVDPFSLGTNDQEMNVTKGTAVTLHCNASTSLFGADVKWYNASNVLATNGKFAFVAQQPMNGQPSDKIINFRES